MESGLHKKVSRLEDSFSSSGDFISVFDEFLVEQCISNNKAKENIVLQKMHANNKTGQFWMNQIVHCSSFNK